MRFVTESSSLRSWTDLCRNSSSASSTQVMIQSMLVEDMASFRSFTGGYGWSCPARSCLLCPGRIRVQPAPISWVEPTMTRRLCLQSLLKILASRTPRTQALSVTLCLGVIPAGSRQHPVGHLDPLVNSHGRLCSTGRTRECR